MVRTKQKWQERMGSGNPLAKACDSGLLRYVSGMQSSAVCPPCKRVRIVAKRWCLPRNAERSIARVLPDVTDEMGMIEMNRLALNMVHTSVLMLQFAYSDPQLLVYRRN